MAAIRPALMRICIEDRCNMRISSNADSEIQRCARCCRLLRESKKNNREKESVH